MLWLLERNVDADGHPSAKISPLSLAIRLQRRNLIYVLMQYGADINLMRNNMAPLHMASKYDYEIMLVLLASQANVNVEQQVH